ncbi:MAG: FAD-dependent oxidoreductase [Gemmatimonadales bacterium]
MSGRLPSADVVVVGGGIVGLSVAMEIRRRWSDASVVLLEKEDECGRHASGRNSGVLHAGFYYTSDSLKARFSRVGNREFRQYCRDRSLMINECGKLVVTRSEEELEPLAELFRRAAANSVQVERVPADDLGRLDPEARTVGAALFSPTTCSVQPRQVIESLVRDASVMGVRIETRSGFLRHVGDQVLTTQGRRTAGYVINAAGLYADTIAHDYGFGEEYGILPFRGLYLEYAGDGRVPRHHVYPVPVLENPFLGVHWTTTVDGGVKIGPTAIPALWREHYRGMTNMKFAEMLEIGIREADMWLRNSSGFRRLAWLELRKQGMRRLLAIARRLVGPKTAPGAWSWGKPGVRAQLVNTRTRQFEMDFICMGDNRSFHILNAVSPAFTCAFPFARHVADEVESLVGDTWARSAAHD